MFIQSRAKNRDGKTMFIGCSNYRAGDRSSDHLHTWIPRNTDEKIVAQLFRNGGRVEAVRGQPVAGAEPERAHCARVISPHIGKKSSECRK